MTQEKTERHLHVVGGQFDERRNTSRVFAPDPNNTDAAIKDRSRHKFTDWYRWVVAYGKQEHLHDAKLSDGKHPAGCPVRGCDHARTVGRPEA